MQRKTHIFSLNSSQTLLMASSPCSCMSRMILSTATYVEFHRVLLGRMSWRLHLSSTISAAVCEWPDLFHIGISQRRLVTTSCRCHSSILQCQHLLWQLSSISGTHIFDVWEVGTQGRYLALGCWMCLGIRHQTRHLDSLRLYLTLYPQTGYAHQKYWMLSQSLNHYPW